MDASAREGSREGACSRLQTRLARLDPVGELFQGGKIKGPGLPPRAKPPHDVGQPSKAPTHITAQTQTSHIFSKIRGAGASFISSGRSSEAQKAALVRLEAASAMP